MAALPWVCKTCRASLMNQLPRKASNSSRRWLSSNSKFFRVSEEVRQAVSEKRPVVALETTIYTHGFPYPENLALASKLESLVRSNGGVPATIGILEGVAHVGLGLDELERMISMPANTWKISRRDMGFVLGLKDAQGQPRNGGTTISGTLVLAHMAGIKIFGTGGLGGVHRGAEQTMDISADLTELGRTPLAVISSGCKSFLDIPKTLEYLETQGVAVATFADGRSGQVDFPAFYTRDSGVKSPMVLQDEEDAARVILAQQMLGMHSGLHFANPIPEQYSLPFDTMERAIAQAIEAATQAGAIGAASTPYILNKIKEVTGSRSIEANTALVEANVVRATKVATALQRLERDFNRGAHTPQLTSVQVVGSAASNYTTGGVPKALAASQQSQPEHRTQPPRTASNFGHLAAIAREKLSTTENASTPNQGFDFDSFKQNFQSAVEEHHVSLSSAEVPADIFVAGSLAVDLSCDFNPRPGSSLQSPELQTSNPARIAQSLGGVGHNLARAIHRMGGKVRLCSAVADDLTGKAALEALAFAEMSTAGIRILPGSDGNRTAQYVAINDKNKDLVLAMADMSILEKPSVESQTMPKSFDEFWLPQLRNSRPSHLVVDGNWTPEYLARWLAAGKEIDTHTIFEPVSNVKGAGLFQLPKPHKLSVFPAPNVHIATPNTYELAALHTAARESGAFERQDWWEVIDALGIPQSGARKELALATSNKFVDQGIPQQSIQLLPFIPTICTKLGAQGVLLTQILPAGDERLTSGDYAPYILSRCRNETEETIGVGGVYMRLFPSVEDVKAEDVVSVNGVGDTFAGTLIAGLAKKGKGARVENLIDLAQRAAVLTLKSPESVSPGLGTLRILL